MNEFDKAVVAAMLKAREIGVQMLVSDCEAILQAAKQSMQGEAVAVVCNAVSLHTTTGRYNTINTCLKHGTKLFTYQPDASAEIARLQKELEEAGKWIAIAKSLAEEARDALPAISMASAKLHNIDLTLAERMDEHFTKPIDAAIRQIDASLNIKGGAE